jgi:hypothetical protein
MPEFKVELLWSASANAFKGNKPTPNRPRTKVRVLVNSLDLYITKLSPHDRKLKDLHNHCDLGAYH